MCECLDYDDGSKYLCEVCADSHRDDARIAANAESWATEAASLKQQLGNAAAAIQEYQAALAAAREEVERLDAEREEAAGECLVPVPEVGSDAGKLLTANRLMAARIAELEAVVGRYTEVMGAVASMPGIHWLTGQLAIAEALNDEHGTENLDYVLAAAAAQAAQRGEG